MGVGPLRSRRKCVNVLCLQSWALWFYDTDYVRIMPNSATTIKNFYFYFYMVCKVLQLNNFITISHMLTYYCIFIGVAR